MKKTLLILLLVVGSVSSTFAGWYPFYTSCGTVYWFHTDQDLGDAIESGRIMDEIDCG